MIPKGFRKYFWDTDIEKIDVCKHKKYIIERLLEMGNEQAVFWLKNNFSEKEISEVLKNNNNLSPISLNYWNLVFRKK